MKVLHLINDSQFTDYVIEIFTANEMISNDFLIGVKNLGVDLKYTNAHQYIIVSKIRSKEYRRIVNDKKYNCIIVHCLHNFKAVEICKLKTKPILIWMAWGTDLYWLPLLNQSLFHPQTLTLVKQLKRNWKERVSETAKRFYFFLFFGLEAKIMKKAISRMDFCATVIPQEFKSLKNTLKDFKAEQLYFSYAAIEYSFKSFAYNKTFEVGNNILVGNSASFASNHLDVFNKIKDIRSVDQKVIVPLSYGDNDRYTSVIENEGYSLFNNNFRPLKRFYGEKEYIDILQSCSVAIMLHERQQALGNLIILFWIGVKIFVSETSIMYSFLKEAGFIIFSYQNDLNSETIKTKMSNHLIETNRKKILAMYSIESAKAKVNEIVRKLYS